MDILAHSLWNTAVAKKANDSFEKKGKPKISILWSAFWGIFPDVFAFGVSFLVSLYSVIFGEVSFSELYNHGPLIKGVDKAFNLAHYLYQYSHSFIIFFIVFGIVWIIFKKPKLAMLGWGLHIFLDIFSHSLQFFPTPFFFPISNYVFPYGIRWSGQIFMIVNYSTLLFVFLYFLFRRKKE